MAKEIDSDGGPLLDAALWYAREWGWRVFPCHWVSGGVCSCGTAECAKKNGAGKHPRISNNLEAATTDTEQITRWWTTWPKANIATPTGMVHGVIDSDKRHGGLEALALLEKKYGPLPETLTAKTGGGGQHRYFIPRSAITSRDAALADIGFEGIDVKFNGGYVLLPPSENLFGSYDWLNINAPVAEIPEYLEKLLLRPAAKSPPSSNGNGARPKIKEGGRNTDATSLAGTLRRCGGDEAAIFAFLVAENAKRYEVPLPEEELHAIARSVCRYAPAEEQPGMSRTTEGANARRLVEKHGEEVRFVSDRRVWCVWNGQRWEVNDWASVARFTTGLVRIIYIEAANTLDTPLRESLGKWALQTESRRIRDNTMALAMADARVEVKRFGDLFDRRPLLLNVANGTLDLTSGELRAHSREDYLTKLVPISYDAGAGCPRFHQFIEDLFPCAAMRDYMQRFAGYCLTGLTSEQSFWLFYGPSATGKSTFVTVLRGLLGPYAFELPASYFLINREGVDFTTAMLPGVRLATSVETGDARKLDVARLKKLTGEDAITAALKYENLFEFRMSAKLVLATNHRPEIPAADDAIWRRVRQVNFDQPVPEEKRIDDLAQALLETEAPGILAWAVRGFVEYQSFGRLREPEELRKAVREYRENEDVIREYVDERITLKLGAKISKQDVYRDYSDWAKDSNLRPAARKKVAMELERLGFVDSDDRRFWLDAVLRQP